MMAVEVVGAGGTSLMPPAPAPISAYCHSQGVVTLTCGTYGNVLRFLPPLVTATRCSPRRSTWSPRLRRHCVKFAAFPATGGRPVSLP